MYKRQFINNLTESILTLNGLDPTASDLKSILQSVIKKISVRNNSSATAAISNFATGAFISDVIALANGSIESSRLSAYSSNLNALIASDENVDEAILDQSIYLEDDSIITNEDNINKPPIVGVPVFLRCDLGPSSLTYCSNCIDFKKFIMKGPINIDINKAVMVPPIVLTVRYLKTSKPGSIETSIDPKYSNIYKSLHLHSSRAFY